MAIGKENGRKELDHTFLNKLNKILEENYFKEDFGVKELCSHLNLSNSQVHRKLSSLCKKSTSQIIREFRLNKAVYILQREVTSASEVSYAVGFSSPTYFNKCFHNYFGYTPGETKYFATDDSKTTKKGVQLNWTNITLKKQFSNLKLQSILVVLIAVIVGFFAHGVIKNDWGIKSNSKEKSIAILPFKNLSNDRQNQYFADGVMANISNNLSIVSDFNVISGTTMNQYRNTNKTIPIIAKELDVNYILESSFQKYEDSIRIISQLIDAQADKYIWSNDFKKKYLNLFATESEIAKQIAESLKTELTPIEEERIDRIPTISFEAYDIYLNGKNAFDSNSNEDLMSYEENLKYCLKLDPDFALAYAALARIRIQRMRMGGVTPTKKNIQIAKDYALKSIELDDNARAHASLGWLLFWFEWDWEKAEEQFRKAIQINPNYAGGHVYLSMLLYNVKGDFNAARDYLNRALYLSPFDYYPRQVSSYYYFSQGLYDASVLESKKLIEINGKNQYAYWNIFRNLVEMGDDTGAIKELTNGWKQKDGMDSLAGSIKRAYGQKGINGVYQFRIDNNLKKNPVQKSFIIAQNYAKLKNGDKTIEWLEIAHEEKVSDLVFIKYHPNFESLRSDTRFLSILNSMNLGGY